ncbi:MAG: N-acetylneuraminate synthase family protein [Bacteriovoracia bacterium]
MISIGNRKIGEGYPLYFIADIAANHDGSLDRAFRLIELAKEAGADAAKFQNFVASKIVSKKGFEGLKSSHQAGWKKSVYEIYEDASVSYDWTAKLKEKCDEVGIEYFTSPYDFESVDHVDPYVRVYKIGSGDVTWLEIIDHIAKKGKPVLIATGASSSIDVERAMGKLLSITKDVVLMQCNTNYTADPKNFHYINLNVLKTYAQKYPGVILGLSDHTHGHATVAGAVALGARVFEKHFTDDNSREGPDHRFAMNPKSWREMVTVANEVYYSLGDGVKRIEDNEKETVFLQRRGLRFAKDLQKGHKITEADLFPLRPMAKDGLEPYRISEVLGKTLSDSVASDDPVVLDIIV